MQTNPPYPAIYHSEVNKDRIAREDLRLPRPIEEYAMLGTRRQVKEWCENQGVQA